MTADRSEQDYDNTANISVLMHEMAEMKRVMAAQAKRLSQFEKLTSLHGEDIAATYHYSDSLKEKVETLEQEVTLIYSYIACLARRNIYV